MAVAALYCQPSNIKLKIFEKLHFDVFKIKEAQSNNRGLLSGSHRGLTASFLFCLLMAARNASEKTSASNGKRKQSEGGEPLEAASSSCDRT